MTVPRELMSRSAALTALAGSVVLLAGLLYLALSLLYSGEREEVSESLHQLAIYRGEIDAQRTTEVAFAQLKARVASLQALVHADGGAPAAALVQSAIGEIVKASGGEVRSAQVLPSTSAGGFEIVAVDCDVTIPASRLRDLVYAVETHRPYLFIASADITAPVSWDPKSPVEPAYDVRWTLHAYRWKGGA